MNTKKSILLAMGVMLCFALDSIAQNLVRPVDYDGPLGGMTVVPTNPQPSPRDKGRIEAAGRGYARIYDGNGGYSEMPVSMEYYNELLLKSQNPLLESGTPALNATVELPEKPEDSNQSYQKLAPSEFPILLDGELVGIKLGANETIEAIDGVVTGLSIGGQSVELASSDFLLENGEVFVSTKDFGKLKVAFDADSQATFFATASQMADFRKLNKGILAFLLDNPQIKSALENKLTLPIAGGVILLVSFLAFLLILRKRKAKKDKKQTAVLQEPALPSPAPQPSPEPTQPLKNAVSMPPPLPFVPTSQKSHEPVQTLGKVVSAPPLPASTKKLPTAYSTTSLLSAPPAPCTSKPNSLPAAASAYK